MKPSAPLGMAALTLLGALCVSACAKPSMAPSTNNPAPVWSAVVEDHLQIYAEQGLPEVRADDRDDFLEAMELAEGSDQMAGRFRSRLEDADPLLLTAALLAVVEDLTAESVDKTRAYAWLRARGDAAMLPRLTLRLKYEKDWLANVDLALALLKYGSGAGLDAIHNILSAENSANQEAIDLARFRAMQALAFLPPSSAWQASDDFDRNWQRLLEVQAYWLKFRQLPDVEPVAASDAQRAELWRMMTRLRSQPLRPVDDARFVYTRLPNWVFEPLQQTIFDENRYVREHALQTLAWIGYPVGLWAQQQNANLAVTYGAALDSPDLRPRVMEAMGASGLSSMQDLLLPWLRTGNLEEITAAADALLRCADERVNAELTALLQSQTPLSPEARYSLRLLSAPAETMGAVVMPPGLDPSEAARRVQWWHERAQKP